MLVPVLVGMDFLRGNGMIVDFSDGLSVCTAHEGAQPFHLPMNHKEHYMIDIAEFLVDGKENLQGHPEINIIFSEEFQEAAELETVFGNVPFDFWCGYFANAVYKVWTTTGLFHFILEEVPICVVAAAHKAHGQIVDKCFSTPQYLSKCCRWLRSRRNRRWRSHGIGDQAVPMDPRDPRSQRSHGKPQLYEVAQQQMGSVVPLRSLCTTPGLRSQFGLSSEVNKSAQSGHCDTSLGGAQEHDGTIASNRKHGARDDRQGHCGAPPHSHDRPTQDGDGKSDGKGQHGQADVPKGALKGKQGVFEARGLRRKPEVRRLQRAGKRWPLRQNPRSWIRSTTWPTRRRWSCSTWLVNAPVLSTTPRTMWSWSRSSWWWSCTFKEFASEDWSVGREPHTTCSRRTWRSFSNFGLWQRTLRLGDVLLSRLCPEGPGIEFFQSDWSFQ